MNLPDMLQRSSGRDIVDQHISFSSISDAIAEIIGLVRRRVGAEVFELSLWVPPEMVCRDPSLVCKSSGIERSSTGACQIS